MTLIANHHQIVKAPAKLRARKVRNVDAFVLKLPNSAIIWTSTRLVDAWADRKSGQFLHPLLVSACAGSA